MLVFVCWNLFRRDQGGSVFFVSVHSFHFGLSHVTIPLRNVSLDLAIHFTFSLSNVTVPLRNVSLALAIHITLAFLM